MAFKEMGGETNKAVTTKQYYLVRNLIKSIFSITFRLLYLIMKYYFQLGKRPTCPPHPIFLNGLKKSRGPFWQSLSAIAISVPMAMPITLENNSNLCHNAAHFKY